MPCSTKNGFERSRPPPPTKRARTHSLLGLSRLVAANAKPAWKSFSAFRKKSAPSSGALRTSIFPRLSLGSSASIISK